MGKKLALLASMAAAAGASHAALSTDVTTAITTAQGDMVALYGALTTAGVAIWIVRLIARRFSVK